MRHYHSHDNTPGNDNAPHPARYDYDSHHHHSPADHILYCPNNYDCPVIDPVLDLGSDDFRTRYDFGPADHNHDKSAEHVHDWVDARNDYVESSHYCATCGAITDSIPVDSSAAS